MSNQEIPESIDQKPDNAVGFGTIIEDGSKAFVQSAVITPLWNGVGQLVSCGYLPQVSILNEENAKTSAADSCAQKIGGAVGMAVDLFALSKFKSGALGRVVETEAVDSLSSVAPKPLAGAISGAKLGAFYGAVLTPSASSDNLIMGRIAKKRLAHGTKGGADAPLISVCILPGMCVSFFAILTAVYSLVTSLGYNRK